jgi:hypothetical protein
MSQNLTPDQTAELWEAIRPQLPLGQRTAPRADAPSAPIKPPSAASCTCSARAAKGRNGSAPQKLGVPESWK